MARITGGLRPGDHCGGDNACLAVHLQYDAAPVETLAGLSQFRLDSRACLTARSDELF
jgi:hypothetical protein